tara:strand:+ start:509 stop:1291 length:783 start_codon:yes stop_codon:yes gene_type:complete
MQSAAGPVPLRSLLSGAEGAVCEVLKVRRLRHRSALLELGGLGHLLKGSVVAAYDKIEENWHRAKREGRGSPSRENWRWWKPQLQIAKVNQSPEVVLERAIARCFHKRHPEIWSNQVPTASGIVSPRSEKRRAIDLVEKLGDDEFAFIELKIESDTLLYAAFEIIFYLCIWLLARKDGGESSPLLRAARISAIVLAPAAYYERYELAPLQARLSEEIQALGTQHGVKLDFAFERFPPDFAVSPAYDDNMLIDIMGRRETL